MPATASSKSAARWPSSREGVDSPVRSGRIDHFPQHRGSGAEFGEELVNSPRLVVKRHADQDFGRRIVLLRHHDVLSRTCSAIPPYRRARPADARPHCRRHPRTGSMQANPPCAASLLRRWALAFATATSRQLAAAKRPFTALRPVSRSWPEGGDSATGSRDAAWRVPCTGRRTRDTSTRRCRRSVGTPCGGGPGTGGARSGSSSPRSTK